MIFTTSFSIRPAVAVLEVKVALEELRRGGEEEKIHRSQLEARHVFLVKKGGGSEVMEVP